MRRDVIALLATTAAFALGVSTASAGVAPIGAQTFAGMGSSLGGVSCTATTLAATFTSPAGPPPVAISTTMAPAFTICTASIGAATVSCTRTGTLTVTGATVAGVTPLTWSGISCTIRANTLPTCRVTVAGSVDASYDNASTNLTVLVAGQALTAAGSTCTTVLPNGATRLTDGAGAALRLTDSPAAPITINY